MGYPAVYGSGNGVPAGPHSMMPHGGSSGEMCQISVPNAAVGAIIGAGGSIIKQIMQDSNAHVNVSRRFTF